MQHQTRRHSDGSWSQGIWYVFPVHSRPSGARIFHLPTDFPCRDGEKHRKESSEYAKIPEDDKKARNAFASAHRTRYYEFSRLPYFDPVRQIIVDPRHFIFLGALPGTDDGAVVPVSELLDVGSLASMTPCSASDTCTSAFWLRRPAPFSLNCR